VSAAPAPDILIGHARDGDWRRQARRKAHGFGQVATEGTAGALPPQRERRSEVHRALSPLPAKPATPGYRVLLDFDGTVAPDDPTDRLLERFADPAWRDIEAEWQAGRIASRECMQRQAALLRAAPDELDAAIRKVRVDPAIHGFVAFCRRRGVDVIIVSDGFDRVVGAALRRARLPVPFFANALEWQGGDRWRLALPHYRADCLAGAANCKCAHGASGDGRSIAIGDGRSDFCMAARAGYVIAKGALAGFCRERGLPHASFATFADATRHLADWLDRQGDRAESAGALRGRGPARFGRAASTR
jgi:HAD superfamily phosphoserine phosphatase-like hydrolase